MLRERAWKIYAFRHALWDMSVKQLKVKYAGSLLGISWAVLNPLLIVAVVVFVFSTVLKIQIANFAFFALSGIFPWMFFSCALSEAASSLVNQQNILRQFNLPREAIPVSSVIANFLNFLIGWAVVYPFFYFLNQKIILLLPLLVIMFLLNLLFTLGLGMLLSVLNVFFRDISRLLEVLLMFWFWVTPVFYPVEMVPIQFRWVLGINPMAPFITGYREIILSGRSPAATIWAGVFLWAFASIGIGWLVFARLEPKLLKRL